MRIDRASTNDLVMLAIEAGGQLENCVGAVLVLSGGAGFDIADARRVLADRIGGVPRFRQRLVRVPLGCGRPVWVDEPMFDAGRHIRHERCPAPGDTDALLQLAVGVCAEPFPPSHPWWTAVLVSGLADGKVAVILKMHHVLADGLGGLAVLAQLVDPDPPGDTLPPGDPADSTAHRHAVLPPVPELMLDAVLCHGRELWALPRLLRQVPAAIRSAGGLHPPPADDCSLLAPTGPRRRIAVQRVDLAALRVAAKASGATVNDALLTAVTGALHQLLQRRGEDLDTLRVTIPVAGRQPRATAELGNDVSLIVVGLPTAGDPQQRIRQTSAVVRAARAVGGGSSPAALFGGLFRALAARGAYHRYLRRQRRFHTLVSNVPGPGRPLALAGSVIESIIPLSFDDLGNVTVAFVALSYTGTLTITAIADPESVPDLPVLMGALRDGLTMLAAPIRTTKGSPPQHVEART